MKRGSFILNGVNSEDINTVIQSRPLIEAPLRKVGWKSPYGVDGDVPFDEGAYSNTNLEMVMLTNGTDYIKDRQTLYNLMDGRGKYLELIPYFDPGKIYRVMLNSAVQFENNHMFGQAQAVSTKWTVKPYKYLVDNTPITLTGLSGTVNNPTNYTAQPIIRLTGSGGRVTLTVNGVEHIITDVNGQLYLNSEIYAAYTSSTGGILTNKNNLITFREYPTFEPGTNTISVEGAVSEVYIEPRWRSLV